jgi:hypothetical protein
MNRWSSTVVSQGRAKRRNIAPNVLDSMDRNVALWFNFPERECVWSHFVILKIENGRVTWLEFGRRQGACEGTGSVLT